LHPRIGPQPGVPHRARPRDRVRRAGSPLARRPEPARRRRRSL